MTDPRDEDLADAGALTGIIVNLKAAMVAGITSLSNHADDFANDALGRIRCCRV